MADIIKKILYSASLYFYTYPLRNSCIVHEHIDASFLFLLHKDFHIAHEHLNAFCVFLPQKYFNLLQVFLEAFLCFFVIVTFCFYLYIEKK